MIDIFLNLIVGILFLIIIWFLIQYGLKFRQERLKLEDHRNEVLKEQQRINEEKSIERYNKEKEQKDQEHRNKLASGYKYYEWKGIITYIHRNMFDPNIIMHRQIEHKNGRGYFKSENDLEKYLLAENIVLKWSREL